MPPDKKSVAKIQKNDDKRGKKPSTLQIDKKSVDVTSKIKVGLKDTRDSSLTRQRTKVKKEGDASSSASEKVTKSSRIDAVKSMNMKKDIDGDLKTTKENLARNRTVRNSSNKPTATRAGASEKISSDRSVNRRVLNDSMGATKASVVPSSTKKVLQTSTKGKNSNLTNDIRGSLNHRLKRDVQKKDNLNETSRVKYTSRLKQPLNEKQSPSTKHQVIEKQLSSEEHRIRVKNTKQLSRERTRTRTLSPNEVKIMNGNSSFETQSTSKAFKIREQASTPTISDQMKSVQNAKDDQNVEGPSEDNKIDDYEDDFEDYESDFEDDVPETSDDTSCENELTSENEDSYVDGGNSSEVEIVEITNRPTVEEEKKLDSGNYDLTESKRKNREMQKIKEALEKENAIISAQRTKKHSTQEVEVSSTVAQDEGFEEGKVGILKPTQNLKNGVTINFANAKRRMEEQKVSAKTRKRGDELLSMIRLDNVNFSLLDLPPVPYDVFMKSYGRSNNQQVYVQTNEDDLSEETQTEEIFTQNKWTQYPVAYHTSVNGNVKEPSLFLLSQEHLGCGGDGELNPELWKSQMKYDAVRLNKFLLAAGQSIVQFLDEQSEEHKKSLTLNPSASFISSGYFNLQTNSVPCLAGRFVSRVYFSDIRPSTILTVHQKVNNASEIDIVLEKCILCVWNFLRPATPEKILMCSNEVSSACFHLKTDHLVFGGLFEGTICVWDLLEPAADHCLGRNDSQDWIIRSPTYSTAKILKNDGHLTEVTAISPIGILESDQRSKAAPIQVCSVEVAGVAIIWTVVQNLSSAVKSGLTLQDLGIAFWGKVQLIRSIVVNIFEGMDLNSSFLSNVECRDMITDPEDPSHFYVCTNMGHVIHCLSSGCKHQLKIYSSSEDGFVSASCITNLLDRHYMLVGFESGIVELFCHKSRKSLAKYAGTGDVLGQGPSINCIQASSAHPGQFFILDASSRIHIWDIIENDISPVKSISLGKKITAMKLSKADVSRSMYLVIAAADGDVELYQLRPEFCYNSSSKIEQESRLFQEYAKGL